MSIDGHVRLTLNHVLHRQIQDKSFFKKNDPFLLETLLQIYTRGIEKEKELALLCHCGPSFARQQTALSEVKDSIRLFVFLRV